MRKTRVPCHNQQGFSLLEIIMVIVMLGILAATSFVAVTRSQSNNEENQARQAVEAVTVAQLDFARRYGVFTGWPGDLDLPEGPQVITESSVVQNQVSVALSTDGAVGLASGNGRDRCVLRLVEPLLSGASVQDRRAGPNEGCSGASALEGRDLLPAASQIPS